MYKSNPIDPLDDYKYWWYWHAKGWEKAGLILMAVLSLVLGLHAAFKDPPIIVKQDSIDWHDYEWVNEDATNSRPYSDPDYMTPTIITPEKYQAYVSHATDHKGQRLVKKKSAKHRAKSIQKPKLDKAKKPKEAHR